MCKIKNDFKILAENLKRRDHLDVLSANTMKPAYKGTTRDRFFFLCQLVPVNECTCRFVPGGSRYPVNFFPLKTGFRYAQVTFKTGLTVERRQG